VELVKPEMGKQLRVRRVTEICMVEQAVAVGKGMSGGRHIYTPFERDSDQLSIHLFLFSRDGADTVTTISVHIKSLSTLFRTKDWHCDRRGRHLRLY
jgi:hypothetical protein